MPDLATSPTHARGSSLRTSVLIGLVCVLVYNANLRSISAGDTYPARYMPFGILRYGSLSLDPILPLVRQGHSPTEAAPRDMGNDLLPDVSGIGC